MHNNYKILCDVSNPYSIRFENRVTGQSFGLDDLEDKTFQIKPNHHYSVICNSNKINYLGKDLKAILEPLLMENEKHSPLSNTNIYIINLDRAPKRWEDSKNFFDKKGIKVERFPATDGYNIVFEDLTKHKIFTGAELKKNHKLSYANGHYSVTCNPLEPELTKFNFYQKPMNIKSLWYKGIYLSPGEFGVWCSNLSIWQDIVKKQLSVTMVFEDDINFAIPNFKNALNRLIYNLPNDFDIASIYYGVQTGTPSKVNDLLVKLKYPETLWLANVAYIISLKGAEKLLKIQEKQEYHSPIDAYIPLITETEDIQVYGSLHNLLDVDRSNSIIDSMGRN